MAMLVLGMQAGREAERDSALRPAHDQRRAERESTPYSMDDY